MVQGRGGGREPKFLSTCSYLLYLLLLKTLYIKKIIKDYGHG
jgi:hypothetical protein